MFPPISPTSGALGADVDLSILHREGEPLGEVAGWDEEGAVLDHRADRVVGGQRAVLYAVHAGPDAGADGGVTVSVSGDSDSGPMGLVHDGRELLVRVLLRASLAAV